MCYDIIKLTHLLNESTEFVGKCSSRRAEMLFLCKNGQISNYPLLTVGEGRTIDPSRPTFPWASAPSLVWYKLIALSLKRDRWF